LPAVVVGRRRRAADAHVRPVEVEAEGVVGESGPGRCRFLGAGGHEEKQRCEKAGGKSGGPAGGLKERHLSKSKRAQRAMGRLLRGGAGAAVAAAGKAKARGGQGVEAEAACSGSGERRRWGGGEKPDEGAGGSGEGLSKAVRAGNPAAIGQAKRACEGRRIGLN